MYQCSHWKASAYVGGPNLLTWYGIYQLDRIIGIEVKKLGVTKSGIARATGLDYNSTPPSDTVRVYDKTARPLDIHAYYLFVSEEPDKTIPEKKQVQITSLALCDGGLLNDNEGIS